MTVLALSGMLFEVPYGFEVHGYSIPANVPGKYYVEKAYVDVEPHGGKVTAFVFHGPRVFSDGTESTKRYRFTSNDDRLSEVKLSARNAAASAATRTMTGATHGATS